MAAPSCGSGSMPCWRPASLGPFPGLSAAPGLRPTCGARLPDKPSCSHSSTSGCLLYTSDAADDM
eukprot:3888559-Alexandrium_andersonii.AAC.1